ncbi:CatB-related O-acetyltransferase [Sphingobium sp. H39-3-25]|uniref:CatB-related O-acetyltransferase n=1 Tax=Sphingobium arseniciresistens TaxID=3030834 RepID=UPI0023B9355D|nr:CatB-related O-acetyltransferase [Sphingobium arseniciresistens]
MLSRLRRLLKRPPSLEEELTSVQLRARFKEQGIDIGLYSYGCFDFNRIGKRSKIGRYCSFADTARIYTRNHGIEFLGLTAYFYNPSLGVVDRDMIEHTVVTVEDDVWLGHASILLPSTGSVGRGAIVAAGAVVTKPVPAYAIVAGNPARVIRMRFDKKTIDAIESTQWWYRSPEELRNLITEEPDMVFRPHLLGQENY